LEQNARRLAGTWQGLTPIRKGMLAGTGVALLAVLFLVYSWSANPSYVTLYSGLDPSDSGEIVEQLRSRGVNYRLEQGSAAISVPESQLDELRVDFASQGLPEGGHVGFEIFEGNAFTATDFVQRLNFQRGLQGELERTIETFPAVSGARVHIVLPERTLFREDDEPATASVVLQMQPGRALSMNEITGVAHLVSGAVAGLDKDHITILDAQGAILFDGNTSTAGGLAFTANQQQLQRELEQSLTRDAQQLLDSTLGVAKSAVSVRARLNFDQVEHESSTFNKGDDDGVPVSTSTTTERYQTTGEATAGAIPGAVTNVPGANADLPGGEGGTTASTTTPNTTDYERTESQSNFEVDRTVTRTVEGVGDVEQLTVSLLLDESVSPELADQLAQSVAAAVGINEERGDQIVTTRMAFDRTAVEAATESFAAEAGSDTILTYVRMALPVVVLLIAFIFFRMLMGSISRRGGAYQVELAPEFAGALAAGGGYALPSGAIGQLPAGSAQHLMEAPDPEEMKSDLEKQVTKLARNHPETVAEVVQSWLREDQ